MDTPRKPWASLVDPKDAIDDLRAEIEGAPHKVECLTCKPTDGERTLEALQVSTRSWLGALAFHTGGLLVDDGWLRILGAGCARLPRDLGRWNGLGTDEPRCEEGLLVGDDALGGFFAWFTDPQTIHYLAPDTAQWEDLEVGHAEWVSAMLSESYAGFYEELFFEGWREEVNELGPTEGISIYPPLVMEAEAKRVHAPVSMNELWELQLKLQRELEGLPDGAQVTLAPND